MSSKTLRKSIFRDLRKSPGRFVAIFFIIAIGAGFFAGIGCTAPSMLYTANNFIHKMRLADYRLLSTMGITKDDVAEIEKIDGINVVYPRYTFNAKVMHEGPVNVFTIKSMPSNASSADEDNDYINRLTIVEGRLPEKAGECVVDNTYDAQIDDLFTITDELEGAETDMLKTRELKVVGRVSSPEYISFARGNTTLGNGEISAFIYVTDDNFDSDYYTEVDLLLDQSTKISAFGNAYEKLIKKYDADLKDFGEKRAAIRYDEVMTDGEKEITDAEKKLSDGKTELADGIAKLEDAKTQVADGKIQIADGKSKLEDAKAKVADGRRELATAKAKVAEGKTQLEIGKAKFSDGKMQLEAAKTQAADGKRQLEAAKSQVADGKAQLAAAKEQLAAIPPGIPAEMLPFDPVALAAQIAASEAEIAASENQIAASEAEIAAGDQKIAESEAELQASENKIVTSEAELTASEQKIASSEAELQAAEAKIVASVKVIAENEAKIQDSESLITQHETEIADSETKIADAETKLADGKKELSDLEEPEWLIYPRDDNPAYNGFKPNADRIGSLAATIPPFMYLIAMLVCLTTMTRLVEEQRTQIGTLKALGFGRSTILAKYMLYAIVVSFLGSIFGVIIGISLFPKNIWNAYGSMYTLGSFDLYASPVTIGIALFAGMIATCGATLFACYNAQRSHAAQLMRPKAPKAGKRVLLERVTPLWRILTFNQKATIRNLFRYKKRLFMTIIGVAGCTALLLTGLGLRDSIGGIAEKQYTEISHYNISVLLKDDADKQAVVKDLSQYGDDFSISEEAGDAIYRQSDTTNVPVSIFVPKDPEKMPDFITLLDNKTKDEIYLDQSDSTNQTSIIITEKVAELIGAKKGNTIEIRNAEDTSAKVKIAGICTNYIYNYIYMTPDDYKAAFGKDIDYESVLLKTDEPDADSENTDDVITKIIDTDGVEFAYSSQTIMDTVNDISENLSTVILLIRNMAAILAIVVLYNLININITEREREIATLKVLGYKRIEVFNYIFSESMILTVIGSIAGLFVGIGLHSYVMSAVETDEVSFVTEIQPMSFVLAVIFTLICCIVVNIIMQPKLHRIEPVSSLKSAE
ncbi:MAG: FtsX-like permease family protein [Clostridiales Family XIII bacterium]|nr:FtsX-like permease family protein [Clostridiales Family XIII bacterium]